MSVQSLPPRRSRSDFIAGIEAALRSGRGFAAGKIGGSEQVLLYHPVLLSRCSDPTQRRAAEAVLNFNCETQSGVFPRDPRFYAEYAGFYVEQLRKLDALGLFRRPNEAAILEHYGLTTPVMHFLDQEPGRAIPDDPAACYLPLFRGKRVLVVSPFADLMVERANAATFEAVWAKTGKRWFEPAHVEGLTVPYGFARATQARFGTSLGLLDHLAGRMSRLDFDVALIGAGGLGIPVAAAAKAQGAIGISLGGHLQALFGICGKRWREQQPEWRRNYLTRAWTGIPEAYRPPETVLADDGAYW